MQIMAPKVHQFTKILNNQESLTDVQGYYISDMIINIIQTRAFTNQTGILLNILCCYSIAKEIYVVL